MAYQRKIKTALSNVVTALMTILGVLLLALLYQFLVAKKVLPALGEKFMTAIEVATAMIIPVCLLVIAGMVAPAIPILGTVLVAVAIIYVAVYFYMEYQEKKAAAAATTQSIQISEPTT